MRKGERAANRFAAKEVELEGARPLVTIGPDDPIWNILRSGSSTNIKSYDLKGAIVRVQPPHDATDADIATVSNACALEAHAYRVQARLQGPALPKQKAALAKKSTPREVVMQMARQLSNVQRNAPPDEYYAALVVVLDAELTKVAL